jgi:hypothetical protein
VFGGGAADSSAKAGTFGCDKEKLGAVVAELQEQLADIRAKEQQLSRPQKERMYHPAFDPLVRVVMEQTFEIELYASALCNMNPTVLLPARSDPSLEYKKSEQDKKKLLKPDAGVGLRYVS